VVVQGVEFEGMQHRSRPLDVSVVVPTRNEAGNVSELVTRLSASLSGSGRSWEIVFVDDSEDETKQIIEGLESRRRDVRLLHRSSGSRIGGLTGAVVAGLAIARGRAIAVMDADLQHPPELVPQLVGPILDDMTDLVVGTRYGHGASNLGLTSRYRQAVSTLCRGAAHLLVKRSRALSDPMSGLFAIDARVLDGVELRGEGFKVLLVVIALGRWRSSREVPYEFGERHAGSSKADLREGLAFIRNIAGLRLATRNA